MARASTRSPSARRRGRHQQHAYLSRARKAARRRGGRAGRRVSLRAACDAERGLRALVTGGAQVATWVTIPEGFTAAQIAERLQAGGLGPAAAFRSYFLQQTIVVDGTRPKVSRAFSFPAPICCRWERRRNKLPRCSPGSFSRSCPATPPRGRALCISAFRKS